MSQPQRMVITCSSQTQISFAHELWSDADGNVDMDISKEFSDAILDAKSIGLNIRRRVGRYWIPFEKMWMIYDPCMTSKWKDTDTASRFQAFLSKRCEDEKAAARVRRHASAARRRDLVNSHRSDEKGEVMSQVVNLFVDGLLEELTVAHPQGGADCEALGSKSLGGLVAKWCPTPGGMHDKALGLATLIREKLLERLAEEENRSLREELLRSTAIRVQGTAVPLQHISLQRDVLTPLRKLAEIPEHFIGTSRGQGVNYSRMPSRCRLLFGQKVFRNLDQESYDQYLLDAAKSSLLNKIQATTVMSAKVNVGVLAPHEVMLKAVKARSVVDILEAGLQWQSLVESCKPSKGRLIIPMCDVSGSMCCGCGGQTYSTCMDVAMALSLLLTDSLPESNAFHGKILTFSSNPDFVDVKGEAINLDIESIRGAQSVEEISALVPNLADRVDKLRGSDWGYSTDFFRAAQKICDVIEEHNLTAADAEGLELVVFSDMEFDEAQYGTDSNQKTMLQKIQQLFVSRFGSAIQPPKIVFWNLRASISGSGIVQSADEDGVALLSGLSSGLLRKYLSWDLNTEKTPSSNDEQFQDGQVSTMNPTKAMLACLEDPLYETLRLENDLADWEVLVSEEEIMRRAEKAVGENGEAVHVSNSSALVAFFFEAVPSIGTEALEDLLEAAFAENPKVALKLLFNLGSVKKNAAGKADRDNFQAALLWLFRKWPQTYLLNLRCIAKFTSLKEVLNNVMFIMYEEQSENDPDNYALFSLEGQRVALEQHQNRQWQRDNQARRHKKKLNRLKLWTDFASSEGRVLFGDLRTEIDWGHLEKKLCIDYNVVKEQSECHLLDEEDSVLEDEEHPVMEGLWEMKERLSRKREAKLAQKKKARSKLKLTVNGDKRIGKNRNVVDTQPDFRL
eukprot:CAMPEP_0201686794 /NCGR_PEP_ID=MMETSP0578-20130828/1108_1 /ASSEMBLY_ACC=CAM_ASM_000663 /TAXON_ID=267565 /ORGANISM="Skeletonema grethea, Strain CCMP 1804" /LENGTH=905 /DNA_ID=CAMNT_0048170893 /DNA_START=30 /DNA_END=2747 /DNA_ORIENTATION=-